MSAVEIYAVDAVLERFHKSSLRSWQRGYG